MARATPTSIPGMRGVTPTTAALLGDPQLALQLQAQLPARHFLSQRSAEELTAVISTSGLGDIRDDKQSPAGPVLRRNGQLEINLNPSYGRLEKVPVPNGAGGFTVEERYVGLEPQTAFRAHFGDPEATNQRDAFLAATHGMDPELYLAVKHGAVELRTLAIAQQAMFSFVSLAAGAGNAIGQVTPELMAFPQFSTQTSPFTNRQAVGLPTSAVIKTNDTYSEGTPTLFAVDDQLITRYGIQQSVDYMARIEGLNHGADVLQETQQLMLLAHLLQFAGDFYTSTYNTTNETFRGIQEWLPSGQEIAISGAADGDDLDSTTIAELDRAAELMWGHWESGAVLGLTSTRTRQTINQLCRSMGFQYHDEAGLMLFGQVPDRWRGRPYTRTSGIGVGETRGMSMTTSSFYWLAAGGQGCYIATLAGHPMIRIVLGSKEAASQDYVRVEVAAAPLLRSRTAGVRLLGITN